MKKLALLVTATLLIGCSSQPPKPLRGQFSDISPKAYQQNPISNLSIRWTGFVIDVENQSDHSCLTIIGKVADELGRPSKRVRADLGRFIACKPIFLESKSFLDKPVTITGSVKRLVTKKIDEMDYAYPLVDAKVIYVW
jgi:outer membrane lipoprotein